MYNKGCFISKYWAWPEVQQTTGINFQKRGRAGKCKMASKMAAKIANFNIYTKPAI